jgi:hypothetical protein
MSMQNNRVARRFVDGPAWSTSLDLTAGVTTKSNTAGLRVVLGHAPARVLARSLLPVGLSLQWATSSRWLSRRVK